MQSMVPEVSLFFGDEDTTFVPSVHHPRPTQSVPRPGMPSGSAPQHASTGHLQSQSAPRFSAAQSRQASTAVANYVNNTQGLRTTQTANGGRSQPLCPPPVHSQQANSHQAVNGVGIVSGQNIPQSYPSSVSVNQHQHNTNVVQASQAGYQPMSGAPTGSGIRPAYCSCPNCPKPPQFFNRPQSYDIRGAPVHQASRHSYPNYGPPPPRLGGNYRCYPPAHPGGFPYPQGPIPASQVYTHLPYDQTLQTQGQYQPTTQMNGYQNGLPHPVSNEPTQNIQMTNRPLVSSSHKTTPESAYPNMVQPVVSQREHMMKLETNLPVPQASGGLPVRAEEKTTSPKTPAHSTEGAVSNSNEVRRSDPSSESSTRSSDDSGLSFTPEKHHSPSNQSQKTVPPTNDMKSSLTSVNWESVPPEIYQLLMQQDRQLKQLQAQIEVLTLQQAHSLNNTTESAVNVKSLGPATTEKCTIATNTSLGIVEQKEQVSACMQTSQQDGESYQYEPENKQQSKPLNSTANRDQSNSSSNGSGYDGRTPAEIRHRGRLPMNSTQREDAELDISQGELVALMNNMHDRTIDSVQSEMIVDLPSFQSSPTRFDFLFIVFVNISYVLLLRQCVVIVLVFYTFSSVSVMLESN